MPTGLSRALCALSPILLAAIAIAPAARAADDAVAELRVVAPGAELEPGTSYVTNTERIRTDRHARCFIAGEGGSGNAVRLPGPTAMGLIETAGDWNRAVDPLSVTDEFGFGLGLCGIGAVTADESNYWSLTVNHEPASVGGDQLRVHDGDDVLWSLTEFPPEPELELTAPPGVAPGSIPVSVVAHNCTTGTEPPYQTTCTADPVEGATVAGGDSPVLTNAAGTASVPAEAAGNYHLQASAPAHLDSNTARVCVSAEPGACPAPTDPVGRRIIGRSAADGFSATTGWDVVKARGGDDVVDLRKGGSDRVTCGGGSDRVRLAPGDEDDSIDASCEKVRVVVP